MTKKVILAAIALTGAVAAFAISQTPSNELAVGAEAPTFEAKGADGKSYSLKALSKERPTFLVFWKERCPHNARAAELFNSLAKAYEGKVNLVSIVWADQAGTEKWAKDFSINHPLLSDGDKAIIKSYLLSKSIGTYQVGSDGKVVKLFKGYGANEMKELNEAMAAAAEVKPAEVDLSKAPGRLTWG